MDLKRLTLLVTLLLPIGIPTPLGAEADAVIADGPLLRVVPNRAGAIRVGQLLVLSVSGDAETVQCRLVGGGSDSYHVSDGGRTVAFAADRGGTFVFVFAGARKTEAAPALSLIEHVVIVEGAAPGPGPQPPKPDDPPAPGPVIPPEKDRLGLASAAWKAGVNCRANIASARLAGFADNFAAVASQIAAGTIRDVAGMDAKLKEKNRAVAGTDATRYGELLIVPIATAKGKLKLTTMDEQRAALDEIAFGLFRAAE